MFEEKNYWKGVKKGGKMHIFRPINLYLENCKKKAENFNRYLYIIRTKN